MAELQDLDIWQKRWNSLEKTLINLASAYSQETDDNQGAVFYGLVNRLGAFAQNQFYFFYDGLDKQSNYRLVPSQEYPRAHALRVTLDQIANDLEIIQRAIWQRYSGFPEMQTNLKRADQLAWNALRPVTGQERQINRFFLEEEEATVLTYFQKSASVRVIPYAPVALIGIPYTCMSAAQDFLAIPHEVGHYVYRHGQVYTGTSSQSISEFLQEKLKDSPSWVQQWTEEIFADVYSCWIGGPVMALDFQDLELAFSRTEFTEDDGEHPVPVLRPYIHTKALAQLNFRNSPDKLNRDWDKRLNDEARIKTFTPQKFTGIELDRTPRNVVETVVSDIFIKLLPDKSFDKWSNDLVESGKSNGQEPITRAEKEGLYKKFEDFALSISERVPSSLSPRIDWENWVASKDLLGNRQKPSSYSVPPIPPGDLDSPNQKGWLYVLAADGWNTKIKHNPRP